MNQAPTPVQKFLDDSFLPSPPVVVSFFYGECPTKGFDSFSCTIWRSKVVGDDREASYAIHLIPGSGYYPLAHEVGHVFDRSEALDSIGRSQLMAILEAPLWDQAARERFAQTYGLCAIGFHDYFWWNRINTNYWGFHISRWQLSRACEIIRQSAARTIPTSTYIPTPTPQTGL